jgi:hypothetical protein
MTKKKNATKGGQKEKVVDAPEEDSASDSQGETTEANGEAMSNAPNADDVSESEHVPKEQKVERNRAKGASAQDGSNTSTDEWDSPASDPESSFREAGGSESGQAPSEEDGSAGSQGEYYTDYSEYDSYSYYSYSDTEYSDYQYSEYSGYSDDYSAYSDQHDSDDALETAENSKRQSPVVQKTQGRRSLFRIAEFVFVILAAIILRKLMESPITLHRFKRIVE